MEELSKVEIKEYNHVQFDKIEFPDKEVGTGNQNIPNQQNQQGFQGQQGFYQPSQRPMNVPGNQDLKIDGYNFQQLQTVNHVDPFKILNGTDTVVIQQRVNILELLTGCEQRNSYEVYVNVNGMTIRMFSCKEQSSCCMRFCCPSHARSFVMAVKFVGNIKGGMILDD